MKKLVFVLLLLTALPAEAQQDQSKIIAILEAQRNMAWTEHARAATEAAQLREENVKLKAEVEELKKKVPEGK